MPDLSDVIVSHVALLLAVQPQRASVLTSTVPVEATEVIVCTSGETVNAHGVGFFTALRLDGELAAGLYASPVIVPNPVSAAVAYFEVALTAVTVVFRS